MGEIRSINPETPAEPHSVEAEQQLLGAILMGEALPSVAAAHGGAAIFHDPVHAEIYRVCARLAKNDMAISPVTVKAAMSDDLAEALRELGGSAYLARMAGSAVATRYAADYAAVLGEQKARRDVLNVMREASAMLAKGEMNAADVAARIEAGLSVLEAGSSGVKPVSMTSAITDAMRDAYAAFNGEVGRSVPSGIYALDGMTGGFNEGELWLLGGRPSMGKTGVMLTMALNAARAGHPVVIASLEMTPKALAMRALAEQTAQNNYATAYSDIRRGQFNEAQGEKIKEAARQLAGLPVTFLPREYQDADLLQVGVKQALKPYRDGPTPLVLIDYAQLMRSKAKGRYEQITEISLALKGMAMSLSVPMIVLSQLSRAVEQREEKRPMMSDLRESGQLEQDADGVIFCYRDEYYLEREEPDRDDLDKHEAWSAALSAARNKLELIVAKQRGGQVGTAHVMFNPAINRVWER